MKNNVIDASDRLASQNYDLNLKADVLVIGGGPAGLWAALTAAASGAKVVLAEKGYVGTAGAQAPSGTGAYYAMPGDPQQREALFQSRLPMAFGLADLGLIEKVYDQSYVNQDLMARWGYAWPKTEDGRERRGGIRIADAMIFLRAQLNKAGARILDHSPVLELLLSNGVAAGAVGVNRQTGDTWAVHAGSVVIATGGTAFLSGAAGTNGLTGDGYLLAAEAGAEFSGLEFGGQYALVPKGGAVSKNAMYNQATLYDANGKEVARGRQTAQAIVDTGRAYAILNKYDEAGAERLRLSQPNTFAYFDRLSINPFKERFEVEFFLEGTIRASGGLAVDDGTATTVPGLFAAGDVTSKERLVGAAMSGAGPAAAWTFASGSWAGQSAANFVKRHRSAISNRRPEAIGRVGLRPAKGRQADLKVKDIIKSVQEEMLPLDKNYFRTELTLKASLDKLDRLWEVARDGLAGDPSLQGADAARSIVKARETSAMIATARWMYASALERTESRGIHRRLDFPKLDESQHQHIISGGLDKVWVRRDPVASSYLDQLAVAS